MSEIVKKLESILCWFTGAPYTKNAIEQAIKLLREQDAEIRRLKELYQDDGK